MGRARRRQAGTASRLHMRRGQVSTPRHLAVPASSSRSSSRGFRTTIPVSRSRSRKFIPASRNLRHIIPLSANHSRRCTPANRSLSLSRTSSANRSLFLSRTSSANHSLSLSSTSSANHSLSLNRTSSANHSLSLSRTSSANHSLKRIIATVAKRLRCRVLVPLCTQPTATERCRLPPPRASSGLCPGANTEPLNSSSTFSSTSTRPWDTCRSMGSTGRGTARTLPPSPPKSREG
mmetsp:Transcript_905/g.1668  ORF Transcript_905/g.1668 Transcript_905/m.1668 type:complete len:235 (+) Transcript_905:1231-1935(+)